MGVRTGIDKQAQEGVENEQQGTQWHGSDKDLATIGGVTDKKKDGWVFRGWMDKGGSGTKRAKYLKYYGGRYVKEGRRVGLSRVDGSRYGKEGRRVGLSRVDGSRRTGDDTQNIGDAIKERFGVIHYALG